MTYEDHTKSWRILVPYNFPHVVTLSIELNSHPWINPLWHRFQEKISSFNSKSFLKHWNVDRDELHVRINNDKEYNLLVQGCEKFKLNRHVKYNLRQ